MYKDKTERLPSLTKTKKEQEVIPHVPFILTIWAPSGFAAEDFRAGRGIIFGQFSFSPSEENIFGGGHKKIRLGSRMVFINKGDYFSPDGDVPQEPEMSVEKVITKNGGEWQRVRDLDMSYPESWVRVADCVGKSYGLIILNSGKAHTVAFKAIVNPSKTNRPLVEIDVGSTRDGKCRYSPRYLARSSEILNT